MDDALRMNLDRDFFNRHIEEPMSLDHLETLVHEGGGVNGDLLSHLPVGMMEGIFDRHIGKFRHGEIEERAPGGGEDKTLDGLPSDGRAGIERSRCVHCRWAGSARRFAGPPP